MINFRPNADAILHSRPGKMLPARLLETPENEIRLVFDRTPSTYADKWIDPELSAVYVIGNAANRLLKIGYADNLKHRFAGLNVGSPVELKLLHFVHYVGKLVAKNIEKQTHAALAHARSRGEWFDVTLQDAALAIAQATERMGAKWWTEAERRKLGDAAAKYHAKRAPTLYLRV